MWFDDLKREIPETYLFDNRTLHGYYKNIKIKMPTNMKEIIIDKPVIDFTDNFMEILNFNKSLVFFDFERVYSPAFNVQATLFHSKNSPVSRHNIHTILCRTYKLKLQTTTQFLNQSGTGHIEMLYNIMINDVMELMFNMHRGKKLYLYNVQAISYILNSYNFLIKFAAYNRGIII